MIKDEENQVRSDAEREPTGVRLESESVDGGAISVLCTEQAGQDLPPVLDPERANQGALSARFPLWHGEVCKRCGRRNCVGFEVCDRVWETVTRGRWNVLCTTCFDEEAETAGVPYTFGAVYTVSWSAWQ
jgi:hypothetical protein